MQIVSDLYQLWRLWRVLALMLCCFLPKAHAQQGLIYKVNPQPDHYFFAPSGLRAEEGQRSFQNISLAFFQSNRMKSRGRSVGWGFVPTFLLSDNNDIPIWINVAKRWETPHPKINTWVGGVFVALPDRSEGWIFHSGVTFGSKDKHISMGVFMGSFEENGKPFRGVMLNGQVRLGQKSWLICENHLLLLPEGTTPISLWGYRKRQRQWAFEFGAGWVKIPSDSVESRGGVSRYVAFPWVSVAYAMPKLLKLPADLE
jgi:hypothetical protein